MSQRRVLIRMLLTWVCVAALTWALASDWRTALAAALAVAVFTLIVIDRRRCVAERDRDEYPDE